MPELNIKIKYFKIVNANINKLKKEVESFLKKIKIDKNDYFWEKEVNRIQLRVYDGNKYSWAGVIFNGKFVTYKHFPKIKKGFEKLQDKKLTPFKLKLKKKLKK